MEWMIETVGLTFAFNGNPVVNNVNLKVPKGKIYGFLGPNGAGKSTTIRLVLRLLKQQKGTVTIFNQDPDAHRISTLSRVGALIEGPALYPNLSAIDNLEVTRLHRNAEKKRIDEVLSLVRLTADAKRPVKHYSMGMKQRLGLATALLSDPQLLVLDEPANGLDPEGIAEMRETLISLTRDHGKTIFLSSHLLSEVERTADWIGIIKKGELIVQAPLSELRGSADRQLRIQTSSDAKAVELLGTKGLNPSILPDGLLVQAATNDDAAAVARMLIESGIDIYGMDRSSNSLENLYFESQE
jgi:ABC-2 type transport system ATP-binding protein